MDISTRRTAEEIAEEIMKLPHIDIAYIDDYKEYSDIVDFQVVAKLKVHKSGRTYWPDIDYTKFNLRKTSFGIRKLLKTHKSILKIGAKVEPPKCLYRWNGFKNEFDGYNENYFMVDFILRN